MLRRLVIVVKSCDARARRGMEGRRRGRTGTRIARYGWCAYSARNPALNVLVGCEARSPRTNGGLLPTQQSRPCPAICPTQEGMAQVCSGAVRAWRGRVQAQVPPAAKGTVWWAAVRVWCAQGSRGVACEKCQVGK